MQSLKMIHVKECCNTRKVHDFVDSRLIKKNLVKDLEISQDTRSHIFIIGGILQEAV